MGSVFAIQVRSGFETRVKEMLKHVFLQANETLVKSIYALETHTEFIREDSNGVDTAATVSEADISEHLIKDRYRSCLANRRLQLQVIEKYTTPEYEIIKKEYRKEINHLENKVSELRNVTKSIHSVMSGYLLIELKSKVSNLPNNIWHLIKSVSLVSRILSTNPIPENEMKGFISNLDEVLVAETEISFGEELNFEEIEKAQSKILDEVNKKDISKEKHKTLINKIDEMKLSVVEEVKRIVGNKPINPFLDKVKAFIKRKTEIVSMPLHYLEKLYTREELRFIGQKINGKDFLFRLKEFSNMKMVLEE